MKACNSDLFVALKAVGFRVLAVVGLSGFGLRDCRGKALGYKVYASLVFGVRIEK